MALTDADILQMVAMALMQHSVVTTGGGTTASILTSDIFPGIAPIDLDLELVVPEEA